LKKISKIRSKKKGQRQKLPALIGVIMGSDSDWPTMMHACEILDQFNVPFEAKVVSAHRTPKLLYDYATSAESRGIKLIIAGAGGAAHLPGMAASMTSLPVLGVPIESKSLKGLDSLLSIAQMPRGIAVATLAIGNAGAANAGLLAIQILALNDPKLLSQLSKFRQAQTNKVLKMRLHSNR
jgi:5-(carboxyamino)imidazole ribonucleotide mutase